MTSSGLLGNMPGKRWLLAVAAPAEAAAVLRGLGHPGSTPPPVVWATIRVNERIDVVVTGVGKANAAGGVARTLDPQRHEGVLSVGIAGSFTEIPIGGVVVATTSILADEGFPKLDGTFVDIASMGFAPSEGLDGPPSMGVEGSADVRHALGTLTDLHGVIATVSECSGTDARRSEIIRRTGAVAEAMEGAAVGFAVRRIGGSTMGFAEVRVISNTTGDRAHQTWDIRKALARLADICAAV